MKNSISYQNSTDFLTRAEHAIPLGSQTFSKSRTQLPVGAAPLFATHGNGSHITDLDGNSYIDFACSLGAITLGHGDADVNAAVIEQLGKGILFSLASPIETEVAERIIDQIPCAEKVRFGKNGSDATAGCIRVARAFTGRDHVAVCGYHGWQDWYIGTTGRDLGVPGGTKSLSHSFPYNDLEALDALLASQADGFAAVIMEPVAFTAPHDGYLQGVKDITHKHGALLIFDEVVTGFRLVGGSAQAHYGVTPDLCSLGKGLANGFPLSAVAGRADVMKLMEDVFFSFTMGGEALSLAAAKACLDKQVAHKVPEAIDRVGQRLLDGFQAQITKHGVGDFLSISGRPCWSLVGIEAQNGIKAFDLKTLFIQESMRRGVFAIGIHFLGYSHNDNDIDQALAAYDEVMPILKAAVEVGSVSDFLECEPLVPLFSVRS